MSMNIYMMKYNNSLQKNPEDDTDSTISVAQRMQGTEAYRQIKEGRDNIGDLEESADGVADLGAVRTDTAVISEEGRREYIRMSQQKEEVNSKPEAVSKEAEYKTDNLSEYTDSELKQMYYRAEITLQEYEDETGEVIE